jgi:hypothetical protein
MLGFSAFSSGPISDLGDTSSQVSVSGLSSTGAVGTVTLAFSYTVLPTGVAASGVTSGVIRDTDVDLTGVRGVGGVGSIFTSWLPLITNQSASYSQVNTGQSASYTDVDTRQTASWG